MRVVVHGLLGVSPTGQSDEVSRECEWEDVPALLNELDTAKPSWMAITIVHLEDFPLFMTGAEKI